MKRIVISSLLLCAGCQNDSDAQMPKDVLYQAGGLWEIKTQLVDIDGMDEAEASELIARTNASNSNASFQECRPELTFAQSPKIGDIMDVGKDANLTCKYESVAYRAASLKAKTICRNTDGNEVAQISMAGEQSAKAYQIDIITSHAGGVSNTVEEQGRLIGPCPKN